MASTISTVNDAIEATNRSADHVLDASGKVGGAAEHLAAEVQAFFVRLRRGPLDRREGDDPGYNGPDRRGNGVGDRTASAKQAA